MTLTKHIIAGCGAILLLTGCSNVEDGFHVADRSNLTLTVSPLSTINESGISSSRNLSIINAVNGTDRVTVNTPGNWKVEVVNEEKPDTHTEWTLYIDEIVNDGAESYFTFSSSINIREEREWPNALLIYVEGNDGERLVPQYLTVRQQRNVLVPTPTSFEIFPASGGGGTLTVESSGEWSIESMAEYTVATPEGWITIDRTRKNDGVINFTVLANRGTSVRSSSLQFVDASGKTVAEINISQSESTSTFDVYAAEGSNLISQQGATLAVNVLSDNGWKVECAEAGANGWVGIDILGQKQDATIGSNGGTGRQINISVAPNPGQASREALLVFSRTADSATDIQGGVAPIYLRITQSGTKQPALSTPWIAGQYDQKHADIFSRYFSDMEVTARGIEIRKTGDTEFAQIADMANETGLIHVSLSDSDAYGNFRYEGGTEYEMRSYIYTESGQIATDIVTFKSPGVKPGNSDIDKPSIQ